MPFLSPVNHKHHHLDFLFQNQELALENSFSGEEKYAIFYSDSQYRHHLPAFLSLQIYKKQFW